MLFLVLCAWASRARCHGMAVLGDNVAALQCVVSLKGRGALNSLSWEIAWRRIRRSWRYAVGHVRAEENDIVDALSRTPAPEGSERRARPEGVCTHTRVRPALTQTTWETIL